MWTKMGYQKKTTYVGQCMKKMCYHKLATIRKTFKTIPTFIQGYFHMHDFIARYIKYMLHTVSVILRVVCLTFIVV